MLQGSVQASALDHSVGCCIILTPLYSAQLRSTAGDLQICNEWIAELGYMKTWEVAPSYFVAPRTLVFSCVLVPAVQGTDAVAFGRLFLLFWWSVMRRARTGVLPPTCFARVECGGRACE